MDVGITAVTAYYFEDQVIRLVSKALFRLPAQIGFFAIYRLILESLESKTKV